jgi:endonuclease/exonuclease/phosphatase family metal-dependent hydrolase
MLDTPNLGPCRGSGVLLLIGREWKIAQYNLSVPVPNDLVGGVVKQIAEYATKRVTPPGALDLSMLTFNIRYANNADGADAWEHRREMVADLIRKRAPEVVGVQEALRVQLDDLGAALPEMAQLGVGRDDGKTAGEYAAILYRKDRLKVQDQGTFWFSDTPEVPGSKHWGNHITRICTWARFSETAGPRSFYVFNVHLDHESQPSREKSSTLLMERIGKRSSPDPVVITGDFNASEDNPAVTRVKQGALATTFVDSFRALHADQSVVGTFNNFKGDPTGPKIDFIFVPSIGVTVLAADIIRDARDGRYPSDHFPVGATIRLMPPP